MYFLMIKTHNQTGLKYFCKHEGTEESCHKYLGSGKYWRRHLNKHGNDVSTKIVFETNNQKELEQKGLYYSKLWNIVENNKWANLIVEIGRPVAGKLHPSFGKPGPNLGRKFSEETKKRSSLGHMGQVAWNKGIQMWKDRTHPFIGKQGTMKGKRHSLKTRQKTSNSLKLYHRRKRLSNT